MFGVVRINYKQLNLSIHYLDRLSICRDLEPIPAESGREAGGTGVHRGQGDSVSQDKQRHTTTHTPICMFLERERKLENLENMQSPHRKNCSFLTCNFEAEVPTNQNQRIVSSRPFCPPVHKIGLFPCNSPQERSSETAALFR